MDKRNQPQLDSQALAKSFFTVNILAAQQNQAMQDNDRQNHLDKHEQQMNLVRQFDTVARSQIIEKNEMNPEPYPNIQTLPAIANVEKRLRFLQILNYKSDQRMHIDQGNQIVDQGVSPQFYEFNAYRDTILACFTRNVRDVGHQRQVEQQKQKEVKKVKMNNKKDWNRKPIIRKYKFNDNICEDRNFGAVMNHLQFCFQAQEVTESDLSQMTTRVPQKKGKINQYTIQKNNRILYFKQKIIDLYNLLEQQRRQNFMNILDNYMQVERTLSKELRLKRLAVMTKILLNHDKEILNKSQRSVLDDQIQSNDAWDTFLRQCVQELSNQLRHVDICVNDFEDVYINNSPQKPTVRSRMDGPFCRGVAKNGNTGWQIMQMINGRQNFIGTVDNVTMAAVIYDVIAIQFNGLDVKTNLNYNKFDLIAILSIDQIFDEVDQEQN